MGAKFECPNGFALNGNGMTIAGMFSFVKLNSISGDVYLTNAKVASLIDDNNSWQEGKIIIDGFVYGRFVGNPPNAKTRLEWLDKQYPSHTGLAGNKNDFRPQPWQQLQKVLREMGHWEDARQVGIAFEKRLYEADLIGQTPEDWCKLRKNITKRISRRFHWCFGWLIDYGYHPLGLFFKMLVVWLVCGVFYWCTALYGDNGNGVFAPSNPLIFQNEEYAACVPNSCAAKVEKIKLAYAKLNEAPPPNNSIVDLIHHRIVTLSDYFKMFFDKFITNNQLSVYSELTVGSEYASCLAKTEKSKLNNTISTPIEGAGNWYLCEKLREEYTGFSPLAYSLDLILPLVDLQQEHDWSPMIPTPQNTVIDELTALSLKHITRLVMWFEIIFGWIGSLLLVAVVSGLTKRREE
jgi:hypothetical protein